jgi:hypothetical protein
MRTTWAVLACTASIAAALFTGQSVRKAEAATGPIPLSCNRACLEDLVNQYLAAVVAHDPLVQVDPAGRASVAAGVDCRGGRLLYRAREE